MTNTNRSIPISASANATPVPGAVQSGAAGGSNPLASPEKPDPPPRHVDPAGSVANTTIREAKPE